MRFSAILALALCGQVAEGFLPGPASPRFVQPARMGGGNAAATPLCGALRMAPLCGAPRAAGLRSGGYRRREGALCAQTDVSQTQTLITRLEKNLEDLEGLKKSVASEVEELQASLAEKKASLTLIDDRLKKVAAEIQTAQAEVRIATTEIMPAIIVGDGRVGQMLKAKGDKSDVMVRSTSEMKFQIKNNPGGSGKNGPIYLCVPNSALSELVDACPDDRREDLVFMGSGNLGDFLNEKQLSSCSQALIYFVIGKLGDDPVDGITELDPDGLTCAVGKWAPDLAKRLRKVGMNCKLLTAEQFEVSRLERLVWTCSVNLVAKANGLKTIGEVAKDEFWSQSEKCMAELVAAVYSTTGIMIQENFYKRMRLYTESVGQFNAVVKDLPFRNGYFYDLSNTAIASKTSDLCPLHTKMLKKIKAVK